MRSTENIHVAVVGLGYVGMPLALALADHFPVTGFDVNTKRIDELKEGYDRNLEIDKARLEKTSCVFTDDREKLAAATVYIVTVPTPITDDNMPDLTLVERATETVGHYLKKGFSAGSMPIR